MSGFRHRCDSAFAANDGIRLHAIVGTGFSCAIWTGLSRQQAAPSRVRFRETAAFEFYGDLQRNVMRNMGHINIQCRNAIDSHISAISRLLGQAPSVFRGSQLCQAKNHETLTFGKPALASLVCWQYFKAESA